MKFSNKKFRPGSLDLVNFYIYIYMCVCVCVCVCLCVYVCICVCVAFILKIYIHTKIYVFDIWKTLLKIEK